ncbi:F-box/kelch-repeat protein At2g43445-like [Papaver somniferum]|uniref:F-box/kelch-repeat protein At2g43445-like n=1 Tax=Papaver somniferum TaxID=3469 RepID=UPI000E6F490E|nr:F-box/kelch-repeat protein At2g43445-like [Papaver somniferum]
MVGFYNGLVCFVKIKYGPDPLFLICNTLTGKSVRLPEYTCSELPRHIPSTSPNPYGHFTSGFGYCPSTNHYKLVAIYYYDGENKGHVQVYTVGGEWRYIRFMGRYYSYSLAGSSPGIYANGTIYWPQEKLNCEIMAFDLEREEFHYITLPGFM